MLQLGFVESVVEWAGLHEFFVAAGRYDFAFIHNHDGVSRHDRSEAVGDYEAGSTRRKFPQNLTDLSLAIGIDVAGSLVEDQYLWVAEDSPGDVEPLSLPAGKILAAFSQDRVIAVR